jgi:CubicO group peptidase (beta-lactamase class C family)
VVAVVQESRVVYLHGYGTADRDNGTPVSAQSTLFRTGSVSNLFTWTAVMQLVERDQLDLHTDVNRYLSTFQIPATFSEPITLSHLLTHTAGFEDRGFGSYARTPADLEPLSLFLARWIPARIFPLGKVSAYSNYGAALAGYLVELALRTALS